jgi:hypothetical protein
MVGLVLNSVVTVLHMRECVIFLVRGVLWWVKCLPCGRVRYPCVQLLVLMWICLRGARSVINCGSTIVLFYDGIRYSVRTLVVGGRKTRCRAAGYACGDEGCCSTGSVMWCLGKGVGGGGRMARWKRGICTTPPT